MNKQNEQHGVVVTLNKIKRMQRGSGGDGSRLVIQNGKSRC